MKILGAILAFIGATYLIFAFNMDVSVSTNSTYVPGFGRIGGGEVANLELMSRRQNHLIVAALITLVGVLLIIFGVIFPRNQNVVEAAAETAEADFDGDRDISSDAYRLWLSRAYSIERNSVFDRYVLADQTFTSLEDALAYAHSLEQEKLSRIREEKKQREIEEEQARELARIQEEAAAAEWKRKKPRVIFIYTVLSILLILFFIWISHNYQIRQANEAARKAAEKVKILTEVKQVFGVELPDDVSDLRIRNPAGNYEFVCQNNKEGKVVEFSSEKDQKLLNEYMSNQLGSGAPQYEFIDDLDWKWAKGKNKYFLTSYVDNEYYLCII